MLKNIVKKTLGYQSGRLAFCFRFSLKFSVGYILGRITIDFIMNYLTPSNIFHTPRFILTIPDNNPINPPIIPQYYQQNDKQGKEVQQVRLLKQMVDKGIEDTILNKVNLAGDFLLLDHPQRQNPNSIDSFFIYSHSKLYKQTIQLQLMKELEQANMEEIGSMGYHFRILEQYKLDKLKSNVIPLL